MRPPDPATVPASGGDALVTRVDFGHCVLQLDDGSFCEAAARGKLMGRKKALGNAVVVGDRVTWEREGERVMIAGVAPRRNAFSRRASGDRPDEQVVAANLDQVVLVASLRDPEFRAGLADRVMAQAEHAGLPARLVINKVDLGDPSEAQRLVADYARAGYAGHVVCAKSGFGVDELGHACRARRTLFVGHSGVGKSTLLNALYPGLGLKAGIVNATTGRGRHTTTAAWLLKPEADLEVIDTPGIRSFALWGIGARDLEQAYVEFRRFLGNCRFGDCHHASEPGCALRAAVETGDVPRLRFDSFLKLRDELEREESHGRTRSSRGRP
jgi:ribosome biogenesis GTPase